ncbi:MAG: hypothetical protein ABIP95_03755 [Pelobium sp.]
MKKVLTFLFAIIILSSCKKEETSDGNSYPQKWKLTRMDAGLLGNQDPLPYLEFYLLNADSTFTKSREVANNIQTVSGTFSVNGDYITFIYKSDNDLISFCDRPKLMEKMILKSNGELYNDTGLALDCPAYLYEKIDITSKN